MQTVFDLQAKYGGLLNRLDFGDKGCSLLLFWGAPVAMRTTCARALGFLLALRDADVRAAARGRDVAHLARGLHRLGAARGVHLLRQWREPGRAVDDRGAVGAHLAGRGRPGRSEPRVCELAEAGRFTFKGFADEQAVYALQGRKAAERTDFYERAMVGRQAELARLAEFVRPLLDAQAAQRFAGILVVAGEAGMGKSRLVHEF